MLGKASASTFDWSRPGLVAAFNAGTAVVVAAVVVVAAAVEVLAVVAGR